MFVILNAENKRVSEIHAIHAQGVFKIEHDLI